LAPSDPFLVLKRIKNPPISGRHWLDQLPQRKNSVFSCFISTG